MSWQKSLTCFTLNWTPFMVEQSSLIDLKLNPSMSLSFMLHRKIRSYVRIKWWLQLQLASKKSEFFIYYLCLKKIEGNCLFCILFIIDKRKNAAEKTNNITPLQKVADTTVIVNNNCETSDNEIGLLRIKKRWNFCIYFF